MNKIIKLISKNLLKQQTLKLSSLKRSTLILNENRHFSTSLKVLNEQINDEKNEDLYWNNLKSTLDDEDEPNEVIQSIKQVKPFKKRTLLDESIKNVFVLQLKMQYKSKSRQSTTAELQLAESIALVETLENWKVADSHIVGTKKSYTREIFGSGNQDLLSRKISSSGANCLFVVIDRLTNLQVDGLRKTLLGNNPNIPIYDRYKVVLEIFKRNARSSIAKLQIALAEIPYIRHKYENNELYKNVERKIKKELEQKLRTRRLMNTQRREKQIPLVSVFGYTNAGKTSFIKSITHDTKLTPENKLFATLDITYHGANFSNSSQSIIFADTIGFISDIPHTLIESFKTSLSDALNADLYIHLVDLSHPDRVAQENSVVEILSELAPENKLKDMITLYNKCDRVKNYSKQVEIDDKDRKMFISCKTGLGLSETKDLVEKLIYEKLGYLELRLKVLQGSDEYSYLFKNTIIKEIVEYEQDPQYVLMKCLLNKTSAFKFIKLYPNVKLSK